jgi:hypothetical protein
LPIPSASAYAAPNAHRPRNSHAGCTLLNLDPSGLESHNKLKGNKTQGCAVSWKSTATVFCYEKVILVNVLLIRIAENLDEQVVICERITYRDSREFGWASCFTCERIAYRDSREFRNLYWKN